MKTSEHFNNEVITKLIGMYNKHLSKNVKSCIPYNATEDEVHDINMYILMQGLEFCSFHRDKFNPQIGTKPEIYFANILKSYVYKECERIRTNPEYKRVRRERIIDHILGEPNRSRRPMVYDI